MQDEWRLEIWAGAAAVVGLVILSSVRSGRCCGTHALPRRGYAASSGGRIKAVRVVGAALIVVAGLLASARSASATMIVALQTTDGAVVCADKMMQLEGRDGSKAVSTTVKVRRLRPGLLFAGAGSSFVNKYTGRSILGVHAYVDRFFESHPEPVGPKLFEAFDAFVQAEVATMTQFQAAMGRPMPPDRILFDQIFFWLDDAGHLQIHLARFVESSVEATDWPSAAAGGPIVSGPERRCSGR